MVRDCSVSQFCALGQGCSRSPYEATIAITLSEDLTAKELTVFWKKLALLLPFLAAIIVALISAAVTLRTHNSQSSEGDDTGATVITGSTPVNDPSTAPPSEPGKSVIPASTPSAVPPVIVQIYVRLQAGVDAPRFVARPHVGGDVVEGLPGRYYLIRLKDADARELVFFAGGKYKKDEMGAELNTAIDAFRKDLTNALASGGVHFECLCEVVRIL